MDQQLQLQNSKLSGLSLFFVYLLLITLAAGEYIFTVRVLGIQWYAYRVLVIGLFIFGVNAKLNSKFEKSFIYFGVTLFLYGLIILLWTTDLASGLKNSLNIAFGIMLTYVLLGLIDTRKIKFDNLFNHFARAWLIAVFFTIIFLAKEYTSGENLAYSRAREMFGSTANRSLYSATFGGPSAYGSFLVIGLPLYFHMVFTSKDFWEKTVFYIGIFVTCGAIILTGSRTSAIAMAIFFILALAIHVRYRFINIVLVLVGVVVSVFVSYQINPRAFEKHFVSTERALKNPQGVSSLQERMREIPNGLAVLVSTNGMGCGPKNYVNYKMNNRGILPYPNQDWMSSHSVLITILAEYGIFVFTAFIFWFFYVTFKLVRIDWTLRKLKQIRYSLVARALIISQLGFLIWSFAFGGGLEFSLIWLYFATITILSSSLSIFTDNLKTQLTLYLQQNQSE